MNHKLIVASLSAMALLLTGCTDQVGGQANPSSSTATSPVAPTSALSSTNAANPLEQMSPCATLDQVLAGQGYPSATPSDADPRRSCETLKPTVGSVEGVSVGLSLTDGQNIHENINVPSKAAAAKVNGRAATEEREPLGSTGQCVMKMEVKPNSRASLVVTYSSDTAKACKLVEELSEKIEPLLPSNG